MATTRRDYNKIANVLTTWTNGDGVVVDAEIQIEEHNGKHYLALIYPGGSYRVDLNRDVSAELLKTLYLHGPR